MTFDQSTRAHIYICTITAVSFISVASKSLGSSQKELSKIDRGTHIGEEMNACDYEWTAIHGYEDKVKVQAITCPRDGIITEIFLTYGDHEEGQRLHSISFKCNSSFGVTDVGPFGDVTGERKTLKCENSNDHIKYIQGAAGQYISDLEVRCVNKNDSTDQIQYRNEPSYNHSNDTVRLDDQQAHIFNRKKTTAIKTFKDACYATKGRRPVEIRIWADKFVNAIQVKYVNVPVSEDCSISHIEYLDSEKHMTPDALNVIGFTSGFTCSTLQQEISLDAADTRSTNIEDEFEGTHSEITKAGPMLSVSAGVDDTIIFSFEFGWNGLWETSNEGNGTRSSESQKPLDQYSIGTTVSYHGPGAAILVGYEIRYDVEHKNVPISLHNTCEGGGSLPYTRRSLPLHKYKFQSVFFLDFHYTFNNEENCLDSSYSQECVADIKIKDFIASPNELEREFFKCFDESVVKIPFGKSIKT
ncbi:uncharacterized protein LOC119085634 [Bradysia coprophila]|uniref:uncharacterized protein LOC119085634 n=1 Tax=Bradysia coprophila TaxID=38358 RepID=UPI00187D99A0|nr:uncharacterized protein LOC119085634 [Bradysia coprophila]